MERFDAAVVGAGPAGSAAAARIAASGARVVILERDLFPRRKVCGEFLSAEGLESLERLGVRARVEAAGPERIRDGSLDLPAGRRLEFRLRAEGAGVSRAFLDRLLAFRAAEAGAELRCGVRVESIDGSPGDGYRLHLAGSDTAAARVVVGAWGRWDALDRKLHRRFLARARYFAWSRDYVGGEPWLRGRVQLYVFPGGYCGLSRVEGGAVNLAGVISERARRRLSAGWDAVVDHARAANPALDRDLAALLPGPDGFLGTVPAVFTAKPPSERGMLLVGDAAGVVDPFSGMGQAAALASGILAGDIVAKSLSGELDATRCAEVYAAAWRGAFARPFRWAAVLRRLVLHPVAGRLAAKLSGPRIVELALRVLEPAGQRTAGTLRTSARLGA
jgi:flavin-dependent dehydrogenase